MKILHSVILGILAAGTSAYGISYNANNDGTTAPAGASFSWTGGNGNGLGLKGQAGFTVLGVQGGASGNEIDLGEELRINFTTPQYLQTLTLGLLFDGTEYGDKYEIAAATANGTITYQLQATGLNTATWSNPDGSVQNLSWADGQNAAVWQITNPFGNINVSDILLYPIGSNPGGNESDFGLQAFQTPDGGATMAMLGIGLMGLAGLRRKMA